MKNKCKLCKKEKEVWITTGVCYSCMDFLNKLREKFQFYREGLISREQLESFLCGWFGYSKFANTYNLRQRIAKLIPK